MVEDLDSFVTIISTLNRDRNRCLAWVDNYDYTTREIRAENKAKAEELERQIKLITIEQGKYYAELASGQEIK